MMCLLLTAMSDGAQRMDGEIGKIWNHLLEQSCVSNLVSLQPMLTPITQPRAHNSIHADQQEELPDTLLVIRSSR